MEPYERKASGQERTKWRELKFEFKKLVMEYDICRGYVSNFEICFDFGKAHGFKMPIPVTLMQQLFEIDRSMKRLDQWIKWGEDGTLGIRLVDDDIDLMASPDTTNEMVVEYQDPTFSGWPLIITIGVVVVTAVVAYVALIKDELREVTREYNELVGAAQSRFCANPDSTTCRAWLKTKESSGFNRNEGTIAGIKRTLSGMVMEIGKGAGAGLLIAIPLLMVYFLTKKDKKV